MDFRIRKKILFPIIISILTFFTPVLGATKTITITLDHAPTSVSIKKAPLKYNKKFAYSYVLDDGYGEGYDNVFRYLNGGKVLGNNIIYPGLYYTDGAGNDVPFSAGFATTSLSNSSVDLHDGVTPSYITRPQFDETYQAGRNILHHGFGPPITDYLQDILSGVDYVQSHTVNNIKLQHFIIPDGLTGYARYVFSGGMKSVSEQATSFFFDETGHVVSNTPIDVTNPISMNKYAMYRKYYFDSGFTTGTITFDVDAIANNSSGDTRLWRHFFTHRVTFNDASLNGNLSRSKWKYLVDYVESNYGKKGNDSVRFVGPQDVYEYIATRDAVTIQTGLVGNVLTLTLNTDNVDSDFVRKSLSLLVDVQGANISSIDYGGVFTNHTANDSGLINLDRGLAYTGNLDTKVEDNVTQFESKKTQYYKNIADTRAGFLNEGNFKSDIQQRIDNVILKGTKWNINLGESTNNVGLRNTYNGYTTGSTKLNNLQDEYGNTTTLGISILQNFVSKYPGQTEPIDGSGVLSNNIMDSSIGVYGNNLQNATGIVRLSNLVPEKTYILKLFGSTVNAPNGNKTVTTYTVNNQIQELQIGQNTQNMSVFSAITPDGSGNIDIQISQKDTNYGYGLLNAIIVQEIFTIFPVATIQYSNTGITSDDIVATITGFNKTGITILNNGGLSNYTFTGNGTFTFDFKDNDGNNSSILAEVTGINKSIMISSVTPSNNSSNIDPTDDIKLSFSKSMNKASVESNINISPSVSGILYQWIGNTLYISHNDLSKNTTYTVTLGSEIKDSNNYKLRTPYVFSFVTQVPTPDQKRQIAFGYSLSVLGIFNKVSIGDIVSGSTQNLKNTNNSTTNISITVIKRASDKNGAGPSTNSDSGIYPDTYILNGLRSYGKLSTNSGFPQADILVSGLDINKKYNFSFFGSTTAVVGSPDDTKTIYTIGSQSGILQCFNNTTNTLDINNVSPNSSGNIIFSFRAYDPNNRKNGYLNVLAINEINLTKPDYILIPATTNNLSIRNEFTGGGYLVSGNSLKGGIDILIGKKKINFSLNSGILLPLIFRSSNNLVEVEFQTGTYLQKNGVGFTGLLNTPQLIDKNIITNLNNVISAVSINSDQSGSIYLKNNTNSDNNAIIRMPADGKYSGDHVNIFYSNDDRNTRTFHTGVQIALFGGVPYAEFETTHFTDFVIQSEFCGNNIIGSGEQCDDGNLTNGDGCSDICLTEITNTAPTIGNEEVNLNENTITDSEIIILSGIDTDGDSLTYNIVSGNLNQAFLISGDRLILSGGLNYSEINKYILTIEVYDGVLTGVGIFTISIIDKTPPIGTVTYSTTSTTNGDVSASITLNETGTITNNGGDNTYLFTGNGIFTFQFSDVSGNTGSATATVNNIDKSKNIDVKNNTDNELELTGKIIFRGGTETGVQFARSGLIILTENNGSGIIEFNTNGLTILASGERNMEMLPPSKLLVSETENAEFGEPGIPSATESNKTREILTTIKAGSTGAELTATGGENFKLSFVVSDGLVGSKLKIYRSNDGYSRNENSPDKECTLDSQKICSFYTDHLSYFTTIEETTEDGNGGSNNIGGGIKLRKDLCPNGDYSSGYYDKTCGEKPKEDNELKKAYEFSYNNGITTKKNITDADMTGILIRIDLAKMISNYAVNILGQIISNDKECAFGDLENITYEMKSYAINTCQLGLMGQNTNGEFNPNGEITRAEFGTILSRLLRGEKYNSTSPIRYKDHLNALKEEGIMKNISNPIMKELRGYVMLMLVRVSHR